MVGENLVIFCVISLVARPFQLMLGSLYGLGRESAMGMERESPVKSWQWEVTYETWVWGCSVVVEVWASMWLYCSMIANGSGEGIDLHTRAMFRLGWTRTGALIKEIKTTDVASSQEQSITGLHNFNVNN